MLFGIAVVSVPESLEIESNKRSACKGIVSKMEGDKKMKVLAKCYGRKEAMTNFHKEVFSFTSAMIILLFPQGGEYNLS